MTTYKITYNADGNYKRDLTAYVSASTRQSAKEQLKRNLPSVCHIVYIDEA